LVPAADKAGFLAEVGPSAKAIAFRGDLGASRAMIGACPALEVISVYGDAINGNLAHSAAEARHTDKSR
jgi:hypothetical protein